MLGKPASDEDTPVPAAFQRNLMHNGSFNAGSLLDIKLLQVGAYMFIWVIGVLAGIHLLVDYGSVLKPLVLAALSVSILEWIVQTIELLQWKGCAKRDVPEGHWHRRQELHTALRDWHRLGLPWDPIFAGRNSFFRLVAVASTLTIVVSVFLGLSALLIQNVEDFAHSSRMESYRHQLEALVSSADTALIQLPDHLVMSNATKLQWENAIAQLQGTFHMNNTFISENQEYIVDNLKQAVGSSSSLLTEVAFYLLYTTMWLFAPLQINTDEVKERHAGQVYGLRSVWRRPVALPPNAVEVEDGVSASPFVRNFYSAKSDPRHGLQERLYRIMQVYFSLKLLINALFAVCVWGLLHYLSIDLPLLLATSCFFLSFIPELGFIISGLLPIPIILLMPMPSDQESRSAMLVRYLVGMVLIKLLVSNVLESYLMGHNPTLSGAVKEHEFQRIKETHPVIILFFVVLAGEIWGPTGMLMSVPFISFIRLMLNFWHLRSPEPEHEDPDVSSQV